MEFLQKIEHDVQEKWEKERVYEFDAPAEPRTSNDEKFMVTFPYPYMNGRLHLGHTFSLSKAEVSEAKFLIDFVHCLMRLIFNFLFSLAFDINV